MERINLGDKVKDLVTGFSGIATGRTTFLNGCDRICITPPVDKDGKPGESAWFDEPQVERVKANVVKQGLRNTGGPMTSVPTRNCYR